MNDCVCCANKGALPHLPGLPQAVAPGTVERMCDECIGAAFLGAGPHPHPFEPFGHGPTDLSSSHEFTPDDEGNCWVCGNAAHHSTDSEVGRG